MQSIEIWKDIDFTKGRYQVSNVGNVRRLGLRPHNMYVEIGRKASKVVSIPVICTNTGERFKSMSDAEHKYGLYVGAVSICISTGNPVHGLYFEKITKD